MSLSNTSRPCAACKSLRRKCTQECIFAPYFPPDNPQRFACVHHIFGASNVGKLLKELNASQREGAVRSLEYEAGARLRNPLYGCVGYIYELQRTLWQLQTDLHVAKKELSYLSPQAMQALQEMLAKANMAKAMMATPSMIPSMGEVMPNQYQANNDDFPLYVNTNVATPHDQLAIDAEEQELLEAQQLAAAQQQRELMMMRSYEQQQQEFIRFGGFELVGDGGNGGGLNQMGGGGGDGPTRLALDNFNNVSLDQIIQQQQQGEQQQHHHHPHTHVPDSHPHAIETQQLLSPQQHNDKQDLEDLLGVGGGPARLALSNFRNVRLDQIQQQQQGAQQHHHPHTHVPHSHPHHAIETQQLLSPQQHNDKQGLEDLLGVGGGPARLALGNFHNVRLDQIQQQQQGARQHHHPHIHVPHSHPHHAIETQQLLSPPQHNDKQGLEDLLGVGGGPARLALGNFHNVRLDQIQQQQQGAQQHHHPHTHVPHSHPHAIETQQHHDKQGLETLRWWSS